MFNFSWSRPVLCWPSVSYQVSACADWWQNERTGSESWETWKIFSIFYCRLDQMITTTTTKKRSHYWPSKSVMKMLPLCVEIPGGTSPYNALVWVSEPTNVPSLSCRKEMFACGEREHSELRPPPGGTLLYISYWREIWICTKIHEAMKKLLSQLKHSFTITDARNWFSNFTSLTCADRLRHIPTTAVCLH